MIAVQARAAKWSRYISDVEVQNGDEEYKLWRDWSGVRGRGDTCHSATCVVWPRVAGTRGPGHSSI